MKETASHTSCAIVLVAIVAITAAVRASDRPLPPRPGSHHLADANNRHCTLGYELSEKLRHNADLLMGVQPATGGVARGIAELRSAHAALVKQARKLCEGLQDKASRFPELSDWMDQRLDRYDQLAQRCAILTERLVRAVMTEKAAGTEKLDTMAVRQRDSVCDWLIGITTELKVTAAGLEVLSDGLDGIGENDGDATAAIGLLLERVEARMAAVAEELRLDDIKRDSMSEMMRTFPNPATESPPPLEG